MRPTFKALDLNPVETTVQADGSHVWNTAEKIPVKAYYTAEDLQGLLGAIYNVA